jgi:type IV pilus assembly protein PilB
MSAKLGELMVKEGLISPEELEAALESQRQYGGRIGECLVRLGIISKPYVLASLATKYGLPIVDLARTKIDEQAAELLPTAFARRHQCIPISKANGKLQVAMADPVDVSVIDEIRFITGMDIEASLSTSTGIMNAIGKLDRWKP